MAPVFTSGPRGLAWDRMRRYVRDPSLRLESGSARDDASGVFRLTFSFEYS